MSELNQKLKQIIQKKRVDVEQSKKLFPLNKLLSAIEQRQTGVCHDFISAIKSNGTKIKLIAECKKGSPSKGIIRKNYNVETIAKIYSQNGASAVSVLTEKHFFYGDITDLVKVKNTVSLPILRKDFIIDIYQIYESLYYGADAILLIAKILSDNQLKKFYTMAKKIGLKTVVEVHNEKELFRVLELTPEIIGINNRNLENFNIDIRTTEQLKKFVPENVVTISESGIKTKQDIEYLKKVGVDAVLIGTLLMESKNIPATIKNLEI